MFDTDRIIGNVLGRKIKRDKSKSMVWWKGDEQLRKRVHEVDLERQEPVLSGPHTGYKVHTEYVDNGYVKEQTGKNVKMWTIYGTGPKVTYLTENIDKPGLFPRTSTPIKPLEVGGYTDAKDVEEIKAYAKKKYGSR